jgi:RNA polymerase sigma-70 factor (ECF subfamily)
VRVVESSLRRTLKRQGRLTKKMASLAPRSDDGADIVVIRRSEDAEVVGVLKLLKPSDQEVLMLAAWEELTAPEIAVVLGISTSASEQRLHRAKRRFAKKMERKGPQSDSHPRAARQGGEH